MAIHQSLPISEWHKLALKDTNLPVRTLIRGYSMQPLIRYNRDYVTVIPVSGSLSAGDIVLFSDPCKKRYVLHRVWKLDGDRVLTWGDNCDAPDPWMSLKDVWGKVILIERGKHMITPDSGKGLLFAGFCHLAGRIYRPVRKRAAGVYHRLCPKR